MRRLIRELGGLTDHGSANGGRGILYLSEESRLIGEGIPWR